MRKLFSTAAAAFIFVSVTTAAAITNDAKLFYKDTKFPQKVTTVYEAKQGLTAVSILSLAFCGKTIFAGSDRGIFYKNGEVWKPAASGKSMAALGRVTRLACEKNLLLAGTDTGFYSIDTASKALPCKKLSSLPVNASSAYKGGFLLGRPRGLFFHNNGGEKPIPEFEGMNIVDIEPAGGGAVWIATNDAVYKYDGTILSTFKTRAAGGTIHGDEIRDVHFADGSLYIGADKGISVYDGTGGWSEITGANGGLPYEDVLNITGGKDVLLVGTSIGAARRDATGWHYLEGRRYVLDDRINAAVLGAGGAIWFGTFSGVSKVEYKMMTLAEKAALFEKQVRARHLRYGLVSDSDLKSPGDLSTNANTTNDNDGLWTSMYIAAECFRYGATHDPEAKKFAKQSMDSLMFLETVTEKVGFIARSFAKPNDPHCSGEWNHITSDGKWRWKGDTSSDELDGHYYAYSIYYDLCADEKEKAQLRKKMSRITNHIIDNDFYLIDTDGLPTTFGKWNPEYLRTKGRFQQGLNSLEILSALKTAQHITGERKMSDAYEMLIDKHNYAKHTVGQKLNQPRMVNHSDDELAFLAYYPLLKYEKDPEILKYYHKSLRRSWRIEQPERNPLWNFIYAALLPSGEYFDLDSAIDTLKRIPIDLIYWSQRNGHRADIEIDKTNGRFLEIQAKYPVPYDERCLMKWNRNPYELDCGGTWLAGGYTEEAGTFWLLPYWMGRYYGYIR